MVFSCFFSPETLLAAFLRKSIVMVVVGVGWLVGWLVLV